MLSNRRSQVTIDYEEDGIWEHGDTKIRDLNLAMLAYCDRITSLNNTLVHICANGLAVVEGCPFTSHPS